MICRSITKRNAIDGPTISPRKPPNICPIIIPANNDDATAASAFSTNDE